LKTVGIVCEYNPLHLGHKAQFDRVREAFGEECAIVCAMSGNFVQRGAPAVVDKSLRAEAAVLTGADLVLELPITAALSSAEGFAAGGVAVLSRLCGTLCFGAETGDKDALLGTAQALLSEEFPPLLRRELDTGKSFPAARQGALAAMGMEDAPVFSPNDILAVEYCKAILRQGVSMTPFPIRRGGSYHAESPDPDNPSATAVRRRMLEGGEWKAFVPAPARPVLEGAPLHSLAAGERAVLGRLRTMAEEEFEALPYGGEGLWRKLMHACRREGSLEAILTAVKSKRYTRSRLDRMVMCAFLGIREDMLEAPAPYVRVLAFNDRGRRLLKGAGKSGVFLNAGQAVPHPCWELEQRAGDLYGLCCLDGPEPPGAEQRRRVKYLPGCHEIPL